MTKKILLVFLIMFTYVEAKKDFYFSFIDEHRSQISEFNKEQILAGNDKLKTIERLVREGQLEDAYKQIVDFKEKNKLDILKSHITLLYCDILYKRGSRKFAREGAELLEKSINSSLIREEDLLDAYRLLVQLKLRINKPKEAKYYAKAIIKIFDNPLSKAYGQIALAQIDIHRRQYKKAIKSLYKLLVTTGNIEVATVVADELYDVYILDNQHDKAYDLASKVLKKNIKYYANDSYLALKKVDKLINANMPKFAVDIIKMLLNNAVEQSSIDNFKFKLANTYMKMAGDDIKYMFLAKEIYKDLMARKKKLVHYDQVKMNLDEILMREGKLEPAMVASKYPTSTIMEQKVLLQELFNAQKRHEYTTILKTKKVYRNINDSITQRFGYKNINEVFDEVNANMIKYFLDNGKCLELSEVIQFSADNALEKLIKNDDTSKKFFDCLVEIPDHRSYDIAKRTFRKSRDAEIYLYLEKVALFLEEIDDAYGYTLKIDMVGDKKIQEKEFLYRFLVYGKLKSDVSLDKFFQYTEENYSYIAANENNPLIIDFYYQYYLYLLKQGNDEMALNILNKLYIKQVEMKAFIYSPFTELELVKIAKLNDDYLGALEYLKDALEKTRKISQNDLAQIYYEMAKVYESLKSENKYKDMISKCKSLDGADNFYKKMCDKL